MAYTPDQIKQFITDKGIGDNPYAQYNYAKQYGVAPGAVDQAMGYDAGTSDNWIKQQGLQGLAGSAVGGTAPTTGNYSNQQIQQFITDKGIANNPHAINAFAQQYGVQPSQIDSALGAQSGQSAGWQQSQGLTGQLPPGYAQNMPPAQPPTQPSAGAPPASRPQNPYMPNPTANPYQPMAGGGAPQQAPQMPQAPQAPQMPQGGPGNQNPYMQQVGQDITRQVTNNLQRNILPGIGRGAVAAGGYGGSRQGIAEGLAIGETNNNLAGQLANLYSGQFNQDRNYGLQSDALDLNVYRTNQDVMRTGQQDQLGLIDRMLGWNGQGVAAATQARDQPFNDWQRFVGPAAQIGGMGGTQSQNLQGNPYLGALGGALTGYNLYQNWGK